MGLRVLEELIRSGKSVPVYESLSQIHESENGTDLYWRAQFGSISRWGVGRMPQITSPNSGDTCAVLGLWLRRTAADGSLSSLPFVAPRQPVMCPWRWTRVLRKASLQPLARACTVCWALVGGHRGQTCGTKKEFEMLFPFACIFIKGLPWIFNTNQCCCQHPRYPLSLSLYIPLSRSTAHPWCSKKGSHGGCFISQAVWSGEQCW